MQKIIIWDENAARAQLLHSNLSAALSLFQTKAHIIINSEPPHLSRMKLFGRTPIIEISNHYWELGKNRDCISVQEFEILLKKALD